MGLVRFVIWIESSRSIQTYKNITLTPANASPATPFNNTKILRKPISVLTTTESLSAWTESDGESNCLPTPSHTPSRPARSGYSHNPG